MINRKRFIIVLGIVVLIFLLIVLIRKVSKKQKNVNSASTIINTQESQITNEDIQIIRNKIYKELEEALKISKKEYEKYGNINFSIYFDDEYLNENMINGRVDYISYVFIDSKDIRKIKIYSFEGQELQEFPLGEKQYSNGSEINPNTSYLIRLSSIENKYSFYYIININNDGLVTLSEVCYTLGEDISIEEIGKIE